MVACCRLVFSVIVIKSYQGAAGSSVRVNSIQVYMFNLFHPLLSSSIPFLSQVLPTSNFQTCLQRTNQQTLTRFFVFDRTKTSFIRRRWMIHPTAYSGIVVEGRRRIGHPRSRNEAWGKNNKLFLCGPYIQLSGVNHEFDFFCIYQNCLVHQNHYGEIKLMQFRFPWAHVYVICMSS